MKRSRRKSSMMAKARAESAVAAKGVTAALLASIFQTQH